MTTIPYEPENMPFAQLTDAASNALRDDPGLSHALSHLPGWVQREAPAALDKLMSTPDAQLSPGRKAMKRLVSTGTILGVVIQNDAKRQKIAPHL